MSFENVSVQAPRPLIGNGARLPHAARDA